MANRLYIMLIVLLLAHTLCAQQKTLSHISNSYLIASNEQKTVSAVNALRNEVYKQFRGINHPYQIDEVDEYSSHFSVSYQNKKGYINIMYRKNEGRSVAIEQDLNKYYIGTLVDDDPNDYVIEYVKTSTVHGGFFFNKKNNSIYIFTRSQPKQDFMRATIMVNLTPEQKIAFAKDFILKTKFK